MALWEWVADSFGLLLGLAALLVVALFVRRRVLSRHGGTFELSHRVRPGQAGRGWVLGLGRYHADSLQWFRIFSLAPRAKRVWSREDLSIVSSRQPNGAEAAALYGGHVVVECRLRGVDLLLAMSPESLTGFQAWLEAVPPGTGLPTT